MRTTITLDDDLYETALALAQQQRIPIGKAVSQLIRNGLRMPMRIPAAKGDFPVFEVPRSARPITLETVKRAEEEE